MLRGIVLAALALPVPGCSCGESSAGVDAAAVDDGGHRSDGAAAPDAALPLLWIDFAMTGCAGGSGDSAADAGPVETPCRGAAPLALGFVPIAPAPVSVYAWRFADESDDRATPDHLFALPGVYDVSLDASGPGGTAQVLKQGIVVVEPAAIGAPCDRDLQCASGDCICGAGCDGLATGFCSETCGASCADGVCADLAPSDPPDPAPWQDQICLADCAGGAPCPAGSRCSELLAAGGGWTAACLPPSLVNGLGESCILPSGAFDDALCASGDCLDEGLRGLCGADCGPESPCPTSAACATFTGGTPGPTCLARCDEDTACDADPWLACQAPGGSGTKSFEVDEAPSPGGYCAPRACSSPGECPQGRCVNGFCGPS